MNKNAYAEITLKSGAVVTADMERIKWSSHTMEWTTPEKFTRKLVHVDMAEIAAIVWVEP